MKSQVWCNFILAGMSITDYGLKIPSPFVSLELSNSEITSNTTWTLKCTIVGSDENKMNIAAFEALLYSAAQANVNYKNSSGIPVSFAFGWIDPVNGEISDYLSYEGFTLTFKVSTAGMYMNYELTGYAKLAIQSSMPVLNIPAVQGYVQPSALVAALAHATKADYYYNFDIDHSDAPTYISHGPLTISFNEYVRGKYSKTDDYESWPGLLAFAKTYSGFSGVSRLNRGIRKLSQLINNVPKLSVENYISSEPADNNPKCASFSYNVVEPTMTRPGVISFKSDAGLATSQAKEALQYGTSSTNVLSISGSYNGVAYNMTDMSFSSIGFSLDVSGETIASDFQVVNSWSSSLADVFQSVSIINDINALASQFSGEFTVQIPGNTKQYQLAQPVSLIVMSGNTLSPVSGIYNITSVSHFVSNTFITTLKLQRMTVSKASDVARSQGITVKTRANAPKATSTTSNIITPYYVDFGEMYPTFDYMPII